MSSEEADVPKAKYVFKARYGTDPSRLPPPEEPTKEYLDSFVKRILGLETNTKI
jgi:hypothetical protein